MSDNVFWVLEANINPGQLDNVKALMREMVEATEHDEPGTLNYEFFFAEDGKSVHVYERYADSGATMIHLGNFGRKFAERVMATVTITKVTVYGNPSAEVREGLAAFAPMYMSPSAGFAR